MLEYNPIRNSNRVDLVRYICKLHNIVNKRLDKKEFDCSKAFDHWGGDCGCEPKESGN